MDTDVEKEFIEVNKRLLDLRNDFGRALKMIDKLADRIIILEK